MFLFASSQTQVTSGYVCIEIEPTTNIYGGHDCKNWAVMQQQKPLLPDLTMAEANELSIYFVYVLVLAFAFNFLSKQI